MQRSTQLSVHTLLCDSLESEGGIPWETLSLNEVKQGSRFAVLCRSGLRACEFNKARPLFRLERQEYPLASTCIAIRWIYSRWISVVVFICCATNSLAQKS